MGSLKAGTKVRLIRDLDSYDDNATEKSNDYNALVKFKKEWIGEVLCRDLNAEAIRDSSKDLTKEEKDAKCYLVKFKDRLKTRVAGLYDGEFIVVEESTK